MSPTPEPLDPARRRLTLVAVCIGQGMILLDNTIVNVALPAIQRGLRVTPGPLEWTINAYVLALASLRFRTPYSARRRSWAWTRPLDSTRPSPAARTFTPRSSVPCKRRRRSPALVVTTIEGE